MVIFFEPGLKLMERVMLTKSCTLFNEDSSFRPFMKVEIGNLVLTGGDCYGGGKVTTARGEVCFKNYKNLDLEEQNCVLPTLDEAKHFSKKAKKLEYSFVENYDKYPQLNLHYFHKYSDHST